jgi:phage-related protein
MTKYTVEFYVSGQNKIVSEFIFSLSKPTIAKSFRLFDMLEHYGLIVGMPYVKKITPDLWELRIRGQVEIRYLFTVCQTTILVLHGFKKKQNKIPAKELQTAKKRLQSL